MKAEELMKGNWVFSKRFQRPVQIVGIASHVLYYVDGVARTEKVEDVSSIPLSHEILAEICSYEEHLLGTGATEEVTYYIIDQLKIKHNTEDWRHEYFCVDGIPYELKWLHQLQQLFTICGIEKEITLDGVIVDILLEPLP